jgi:hypothetical protein
VSGGWAYLARRSLPLLLALAWFLLLIGGVSVGGGLVHVILLVAVALFGYQVMTGSPG